MIIIIISSIISITIIIISSINARGAPDPQTSKSEQNGSLLNISN